VIGWEVSQTKVVQHPSVASRFARTHVNHKFLSARIAVMLRKLSTAASSSLEKIGATGRRYHFKELIQERPIIGRVWIATSDLLCRLAYS